MADPKDNYRLYLDNAHEMLDVAKANLANDFYSSACNRAYYAVFYAASALLYSKGKMYSKHSAVVSAFREHFVKTGELDKKWSDVYKFIMSSRHVGDYELSVRIEKEQAVDAVLSAQEFVEVVEQWLIERKLL